MAVLMETMRYKLARIHFPEKWLKGTTWHDCKAELVEEREIKEMLLGSVCDLRCTVAELQDRLRSVDGEVNAAIYQEILELLILSSAEKLYGDADFNFPAGLGTCANSQRNEWKTRFETQVELNGQLERQISHLQQRLEGIKVNPVDRLAFIRSYEDMAVEMLKQHLEVLSEEKSDLQSRLRDRHLQIDLEGKAFHKTNDERRAYLTEIAALSSVREQQRRQRSNQRQGAPVSKRIRAHRGKDIPRKAQHGPNNGEEDGFRECVNGGGVIQKQSEELRRNPKGKAGYPP